MIHNWDSRLWKIQCEFQYYIEICWKYGNIYFSLKLTCRDNKFNSSSKHNPDVIHTHIYLAAKTPAKWESVGMSETYLTIVCFYLRNVLFHLEEANYIIWSKLNWILKSHVYYYVYANNFCFMFKIVIFKRRCE